jgi:hypothetical protein
VILSGNQALDPAGFAPALFTSTRKKVTGHKGKILRAAAESRKSGEY